MLVTLKMYWVFKHKKTSESNIYAIPITPHATRPPAFPVFIESGWSVLPRSSIVEWTTIARPMMLFAPKSEMTESEKTVETTPFELATTFPRSPTWRIWSCGPPCFKLSGLKCPPVLLRWREKSMFFMFWNLYVFSYLQTSTGQVAPK